MIWFGEEVSSKEKERKKEKKWGWGGGGEEKKTVAAQRSALTVLCVVVVALKNHLIIMWFGEEVSCNTTWSTQRSAVILLPRHGLSLQGQLRLVGSSGLASVDQGQCE